MRRTLTSKQQNKELCPSNLDYCLLEDVTHTKKKTLLELFIGIPHMPCQTLHTNLCEKQGEKKNPTNLVPIQIL